ncbi:hypothetical protein ACTWQL_22205 [Pseudalkalibacillus sp. R45]
MKSRRLVLTQLATIAKLVEERTTNRTNIVRLLLSSRGGAVW